jgi:hypothetical protein
MDIVIYVFLELWAACYSTEWAVKKVIHQLESEALSGAFGRRKSSLRLFQRVSRLLLICIATGTTLMIQTCPHKTHSPLLIEVIAFNTDDKIMQDDAHASPHDDDLVSFGVDELNPNLLQGLKRPLQ